MTRPDDLEGVSEHLLPDELVERLLTGASPGAGVDEPTVAVAQVLHAARQAPTATELAEADAAAATFVARMAGVTSTVISLDDHRRRRAGRVSARVAAGVAALTLFSAGAAAAATGNLPDPVQRTVAQAVSHVGVDLPTPDDHDGERADGPDDDGPSTSAAGSSSSSSSATTAASPSSAASTSAATTPSSATTDSPDSSAAEGSSVSTPVGPDVTGEAKKGLCTAYEQQRKNGAEPNGVAFDNLRKAADAAGQSVDEFCDDDGAPATTEASTPEGTRPSTGTTEPDSDADDSTSVPKPKGPPATYKGPDEPVTATTDRTLPPRANGTIPSATSVKPGKGGGDK